VVYQSELSRRITQLQPIGIMKQEITRSLEIFDFSSKEEKQNIFFKQIVERRQEILNDFSMAYLATKLTKKNIETIMGKLVLKEKRDLSLSIFSFQFELIE
jgi:hypothetical protein